MELERDTKFAAFIKQDYLIFSKNFKVAPLLMGAH